MSYDVAVVGGGVVGLACARELAARGRSVLLLERHARYGEETSSRNSGVVHAGIYYPTGSTKAELCVRGNRSLYQWCEERDVPFARVGKYIVAVEAAEEPALAEIAARARANGAVEVEPCGLEALRSAEPHVRAVAALWSPRTGIVDAAALMRSLFAACADGVDFAFRRRVVAVERDDRGAWILTARDPSGAKESAVAAQVVNAAGLDADELAALAGIDVDACGYRQRFVKGSYFRLRSSKSSLVRHLVYPVPPRDQAGLGVHVTLELDGSVRLGPDVEPISRVYDYRVDADRASAFAAAASRYLPGICARDLSPDQAGIRPKLRAADGAVPDFVVREESAVGLPGWVNLVGIESPGLTCCLEIATRVATLL
ncbi:MAG: Aminobutyraldehyde dehydrogenase [bacterium]|nr:Aminobutyraldehyde dehydrogenase [bacterium]